MICCLIVKHFISAKQIPADISYLGYETDFYLTGFSDKSFLIPVRHENAFESQLAGFRNPLLDTAHGTNLSRKSDFTGKNRVTGQSRIDIRRQDRHNHRQIQRRIAHNRSGRQ